MELEHHNQECGTCKGGEEGCISLEALHPEVTKEALEENGIGQRRMRSRGTMVGGDVLFDVAKRQLSSSGDSGSNIGFVGKRLQRNELWKMKDSF